MSGIFGETSTDLYIDSWTETAFKKTGGGTYITRAELAAIGQVHRSAEGCDTFQALTGRDISSGTGLEALFQSAKIGEIDLPQILTSRSLIKYVNRKTMFALD